MGDDCHDIAFVNLLCSIMLKYLKQNKMKKNVDHILRCNVAKSWAKFGPNCQFSPIWNILVNLNVTFTCLLQLIMLVNTNINKVDHEIWSCINFGQFDQIIYLSQKSFFGTNDCFFLLTFCVLSCFLTLQKDYLSRSWYWRLEKYGKIRL